MAVWIKQLIGNSIEEQVTTYDFMEPHNYDINKETMCTIYTVLSMYYCLECSTGG